MPQQTTASTSRADFVRFLLEAPRSPHVAQLGSGSRPLEHLVDEALAALSSRSVGAGDRVVVQLTDPSVFTGTLIALWLLDATPVIVDPRVSDTAVDDLVRVVKPRNRILRDGQVWESETDSVPAPSSSELMIQLTSGTTGRFRVVSRDAASVQAEIHRYSSMVYVSAETQEVVLGSSPFHTFGLIGAVLSGIAGGKDISFARQMTASEIAGGSSSDGRALVTVPTALRHLMTYRGGVHLSSFRGVLFAGERLGTATAERLAAIGASPVNIFGTTETGLLAQSSSADALGSLSPSGTRQLDVANGRLRVLMDRSPYLFHDDPRSSDGWFSTGDIVETDGSGAFTILGRADSQISLAGRKVNLSRVEDAAIATGMCSGAVANFSSRIELFVELSPEASRVAFQETLYDALESVERPSRILFMEALPRTYGGKLVRDLPTLRSLAGAENGAG